MSTLENLRFYAANGMVFDRQNQKLCIRFDHSFWKLADDIAGDTAHLLNQLPEWESNFIWEPAPAMEGNAS